MARKGSGSVGGASRRERNSVVKEMYPASAKIHPYPQPSHRVTSTYCSPSDSAAAARYAGTHFYSYGLES